jgi:hypothetical protein
VVWGDTNAPVNVPANVIAPKAIAAGGKHALALLNDGSVKAWGDNSAGQCNVPEFPTNVLTIAAGAEHSLALLSNGRVAQWGWGENNWPLGSEVNIVAVDYYLREGDFDKNPDNGMEYAFYYRHIELDLLAKVEISSGSLQGVASAVNLDSDTYEILFDSRIDVNETLFFDGIVPLWDDCYFILVTHDAANQPIGLGYLTAQNAAGEIGIAEVLVPAGPPVGSVSIEGATAIAAGDYHSLAILTNGTVTAWGTNDFGQCDVPASVTNAISISANRRFSSAVLQDGSVVVWGGGVGNDE